MSVTFGGKNYGKATPSSQGYVEDWLDQIETEGRGLTSWEIDFCESVRSQLQAGRLLTSKQAEIVERIYAEKTP